MLCLASKETLKCHIFKRSLARCDKMRWNEWFLRFSCNKWDFRAKNYKTSCSHVPHMGGHRLWFNESSWTEAGLIGVKQPVGLVSLQLHQAEASPPLREVLEVQQLSLSCRKCELCSVPGRPLRFKLKNIIQQYSWENNVLKEQEEEEEDLLPVWMIYCWFTELMELLLLWGMWRVKIRTILWEERVWWRETAEALTWEKVCELEALKSCFWSETRAAASSLIVTSEADIPTPDCR